MRKLSCVCVLKEVKKNTKNKTGNVFTFKHEFSRGGHHEGENIFNCFCFFRKNKKKKQPTRKDDENFGVLLHHPIRRRYHHHVEEECRRWKGINLKRHLVFFFATLFNKFNLFIKVDYRVIVEATRRDMIDHWWQLLKIICLFTLKVWNIMEIK